MVDITELRVRWAPLLRIAFASISDIVADYFFYQEVVNDEDPAVEKYQLYLFIFLIVSAVMCGLSLLSVLFGGFCPQSGVARNLNKVLALETIVGDVPQLVLTGLITYDKGLMTIQGAFNIATSAYNFVYNALESCGNPPAEKSEEKEAPASVAPDQPVDDPEVQLHEAVVEA